MRALIGLCLVLTWPAWAQEIHSPHCLYGCPAGAPVTNDVIIREIYILSSNDTTKFADWAAYKVTEDTISSTQSRTWKADPLLARIETLEPDDYKDAHAQLETDRGHQVPLASFTGTPHWRDTNYLSNITPQKSDLNQGAWLKVENGVRKIIRDTDVTELYVMTGPLYERAMPDLPRADEAHKLPSAYWKIVVQKDGNSAIATGFIFDQETDRGDSPCSHLATVRTIEQRSGLDFFHWLERPKQDDIENDTAGLRSSFGC